MGVKSADPLSSLKSAHNIILQAHIWCSTSVIKPTADGVVLYLFIEKKNTYKWTCTTKSHGVQGASVHCFYLSAFSKAVQFREKARSLTWNDHEKRYLRYTLDICKILFAS